MITPMLLSIYIHTTLPIPMPLSSSAAISLAAKFSFPGFIHGVVKPILPTPSTFCQANTPDPDLQLSPLNCYFRDGGAAAVIPCRYCFFRDLVGPDPSSAPLESVLYFPGRCGHAASASTATIVPIGPVGPVGPIGPRRCHQIVFSRLEAPHPGPGSYLMSSQEKMMATTIGPKIISACIQFMDLCYLELQLLMSHRELLVPGDLDPSWHAAVLKSTCLFRAKGPFRLRSWSVNYPSSI